MAACKKDTKTTPPPAPVPTVPGKVKFVFVNRIGFRNDSTRHGVNDTVFQGPCLEVKFYDKKANYSYQANVCYNRNFASDNFPTTDSITFNYTFNSSVGCMYTYAIDLVWKCPAGRTKVLQYSNINYQTGDTIKTDQDVVIKFIWPNDTNSGRFVKTYQWP